MVKINGSKASSTVEVTKKSGGDVAASSSETKEEGVLVESEEPLATVGFKAGRTMNLGNYNSIKVEVSLFMPCKVLEVGETFEIVTAWVDEKISEICKDVQPAND